MKTTLNNFILEFTTINQEANLASNSTPQQYTFDGGDGPSAGEYDLSKEGDNKTVKNVKKEMGSNVELSHKIRETEKEKGRKSQKVLKMKDFHMDNDKAKYAADTSPSKKAGGASYVTQGF